MDIALMGHTFFTSSGASMKIQLANFNIPGAFSAIPLDGIWFGGEKLILGELADGVYDLILSSTGRAKKSPFAGITL